MSRQPTLEYASLEHCRIRGGNKYTVVAQTLSGTYTMDADMPHLQALNPDGSTREVDLPAEVAGLWFIIANAEDVSGDLTVKDDSGTTTIATVAPGGGYFFFCDGTTWYTT